MGFGGASVVFGAEMMKYNKVTRDICQECKDDPDNPSDCSQCYHAGNYRM